ncbi:unnamed protein product [Closterium sp. NIES-53]
MPALSPYARRINRLIVSRDALMLIWESGAAAVRSSGSVSASSSSTASVAAASMAAASVSPRFVLAAATDSLAVDSESALAAATAVATAASANAAESASGAESATAAESADAVVGKKKASKGRKKGEEGEEGPGEEKVKSPRRKAVRKSEKVLDAATPAAAAAAEAGEAAARAGTADAVEGLGKATGKRTKRKARSKAVGTAEPAGAVDAALPGAAAETAETAVLGGGTEAAAEAEEAEVSRVSLTPTALVASAVDTTTTSAGGVGGASGRATRASRREEVERWLVVVESPSKARTIQGYLQHLASDPEPPLILVTAGAAVGVAAGGEVGTTGGAGGVKGRRREFSVLATHGHVRDVPNKVDAVSPEADFAIDWRILPQAVPHFRAIALAAFRSQGVVLATDADREGEAIAWHVYQLLKGAAAARRRAEVQQREKEQRREKMVQQAVLIEEQLAAEAQEAAEEEGAVLQGAEGWEGESDLFSNGAAAANSSLISPEAEGLGSLDGSASANVAAAHGGVGGVGESQGEGLKQQGGEHVEQEGQHGWLEGEELLGEVRKELKESSSSSRSSKSSDYSLSETSLSPSSSLTLTQETPSPLSPLLSPSLPPSPSNDEWLLPAAGSNGCDLTIHRATFHEITPSAVLSALSHPRLLSQPLVDAYFARRVLDFLMGFNLSPVLWRKLPGCKSAGRVQSVALRFVCEREGEVAGFNTQEYWTVSAMVQACRTTKGALLESSKGLLERKLAGRGREVGEGREGREGGAVGAGVESDAPLSFPARLTHLFGEPVGAGAGAGGGGGGGAGGGRRAKEGKEAKEAKEEKQGKEGDENSVAAAAAAEVEGGIRDGERALAAAVLVEGSELQVQGVHRSQTRRSPSPPFTTSSMQQEASSKLGFSPSRTMAGMGRGHWRQQCWWRGVSCRCRGAPLADQAVSFPSFHHIFHATESVLEAGVQPEQNHGVSYEASRVLQAQGIKPHSLLYRSCFLPCLPTPQFPASLSPIKVSPAAVCGSRAGARGLPSAANKALHRVAQRLYEGVALGPEASRVLQGEGAGGTKGAGRKGAGGGGGMVTGLITYMRTDSVQCVCEKLRGLAGGGGVVTGLITYMCTDSVQVSQAAVAPLYCSLLQQQYGSKLVSCLHPPTSLTLPFPPRYPPSPYQVSQTAVASLRSLLQQKYGSKLVSPSPRVFASKARNAQEAHEAIRPTHPHLLPGTVWCGVVWCGVAVDISAYPLDPSLLSAFPSQDPSASESPSLDPAAPSTSPPAVLRANAFAIAWPGFLAAYSVSCLAYHLIVWTSLS